MSPDKRGGGDFVACGYCKQSEEDGGVTDGGRKRRKIKNQEPNQPELTPESKSKLQKNIDLYWLS
jgi:hypothetical protein